MSMEVYGTMNHGPGRPRKQGGPWTNHENDRLRELVERYSINKSQLHWVEIAKEHGTRDAKQCRERWDNHLKPGVNRSKINAEQGQYIMKWVHNNGKHWAPLGRLLQRPENMVKNYYYQESKKAERGGAKHRRHARSQTPLHDPLSSSVPMSRNNSGSSSHHGYGPSPVSQQYCLPADYNPHKTPGSYEPFGVFTSPHQYQSQLSRRTSIASVATNPPPLTPDHGSPAESPRTGPEIPYNSLGQFTLPPFNHPQTMEKPFHSLFAAAAEGAGHKRNNSTSSYGSNYGPNPHSPTWSTTRHPSASRFPQVFDSAPVTLPPLLHPTAKSDEATPKSRQGSDARMSLSHLLCDK